MPISAGTRYMAAGAFYFSLMSFLVKLVGQAIPNQEIVFVRGLLTLGFTWVLLRRAGIAPLGFRRGALLLRGFLGFAALSCFYYALVHLPLAEATVLQYTNPLWAALLAGLFLAERMSRRELALVGASLAGVVMMSRPGLLFGGLQSGLDSIAVVVALTGAALSGAAYVMVRELSQTEHPLVIVFYFPLVTIPAALPGALARFVWPSPWQWLLLVGVGITAQIGQIYITRGLQLEPAGRATAIGYLQVVLAGLLGLLFFAERPDAWTVAGASVILGSTLLLALQRREPGTGVILPAPPESGFAPPRTVRLPGGGKHE